MTDLSQLYGQNHQQEDQIYVQNKFITQIATNIAHVELPLILEHEGGWNPELLFDLSPTGSGFRPGVWEKIVKKIQALNPAMKVLRLLPNQRKVLPWVIDTPGAEYILVKDCQTRRLHAIYITPIEVGAY